MPRTIEFSIEYGNIVTFSADVVALKYAQEFYGVDKQIMSHLYYSEKIPKKFRPQIGKYSYVETSGRIQFQHVLFVGVQPLYEFSYQEIREFSAMVLKILADEAPNIQHLAMTIHGVGYGLDEAEAFLAQFSGYLDAIRAGELPLLLNRISIVEIDRRRVRLLRRKLRNILAHTDYALQEETPGVYRLAIPQQEDTLRRASRGTFAIESAGSESDAKPHIFVAMPFSRDMDDVFYYGIQRPAHDAGFLCERIDQDSFIGDILDRIKRRIETATIVIAELSGANPNVYLEIGYAWGKERPTILLVKDTKELRFDVHGQRCLVYDRIRDLEEALAKELRELKSKGFI